LLKELGRRIESLASAISEASAVALNAVTLIIAITVVHGTSEHALLASAVTAMVAILPLPGSATARIVLVGPTLRVSMWAILLVGNSSATCATTAIAPATLSGGASGGLIRSDIHPF
jgi:hypothetical protein